MNFSQTSRVSATKAAKQSRVPKNLKKVNDDFEFKYRHRISSDNNAKINDSSLEIEADFDHALLISNHKT